MQIVKIIDCTTGEETTVEIPDELEPDVEAAPE